jgi:L-ascorbate metabolism protein UlaG (beta-lactamase superfamily)
MKLTHFGHACLLVETAHTRILIDPGTLSTGWTELTDIDAVLITHQHPDHVDLRQLPVLATTNPGMITVTSRETASALGLLGGGSVRAVEPGESFEIHGSRWSASGGAHAVVHPLIPTVPNTAFYAEEEGFFHPGDSWDVPDRPIDVLALPASGPWLKIGESIDYLVRVSPRVALPIHEGALSDTTTHFGMLQRCRPSATEVRIMDRAVPLDLAGD